MNADGTRVSRLTASRGGDRNPVWSPDGRRIACDTDRSGNQDVYVVDAAGRAEPTMLTTSPARDADPAWSRNGKRLAFASNRNHGLDIYAMNPDGTEQKRLTTSGENLVPNW
jgi:TolB protein